MGSTLEVWSWVPVDGSKLENPGYEWKAIYAGESLYEALEAFKAEKVRYAMGCVKLEWR
jgi:YHS domain-containing protein